MRSENPSGKAGVVSPQSEYDYFLQELKIVNAVGLAIEIGNVFEEINIYEDLFSNVLNGDITINDSTNLINRLQIHGNEFLLISFRTPSLTKYEKAFRIYKVSDLKMRHTSNANYKLHFCSEEFFINQQYTVSKSFKETRLSDVVKIIARNALRISDKKLPLSEIEESTVLTTPEKSPLIVPNLRPFEAINWIGSFALSKFDLSPGFFFYENSNGFNFRSFSNLYSAPSKKTIVFAPKNDDQTESVASKHDKMDQMQFKQVFDMLDSVNNGAFGSTIRKIDFLNRTTETERFALTPNSFTTLNNNLPFNLAKNRIGNSIVESSNFERFFPKFQGDLVSRWLLVRASRIALLNSAKLHVDFPGDSSLSVGDIITVNIPENSAQTDARGIQLDMMMSGRYMITGLRHQLLANKYICNAQLCKDSLMVNLNYVPPFNTSWNTAINT